MQGPWSYDDSMGGNTIMATEDDTQCCPSCGGRTVHAEECPGRAG